MDVKAIHPVSSPQAAASAEREQQSSTFRCGRVSPSRTEKDSRFEVVNEDGNVIVYRAVDPETGIVLTEVPSEEVRRVSERLRQLRSEGKIE